MVVKKNIQDNLNIAATLLTFKSDNEEKASHKYAAQKNSSAPQKRLLSCRKGDNTSQNHIKVRELLIMF